LTDTRAPEDARQLRNFKALIGLAILTTMIAALAGLLLFLIDPSDGSTTEKVLGLTAATSGIATGALAIAAAIYAQVKNLWRYVPTWGRAAAWVLIISAVAYSWIRAL
jgi:hypothetical protein